MVPDAVVVLDGDGPLPVVAPLPPGTPVLAADGGLGVARRLGLVVTDLVGDLDSADPDEVAAATAAGAGATLHRHPVDKDATDGALALALAVDLAEARHDRGAAARPHVVVLGPGGGRLDQLLADLALLTADLTEPVEVTAQLGTATVLVVRTGRPRRLVDASGTPPTLGALVSLLPIGGPAHGVATTGLRWPLADATLSPGETRGVSNEVVDPAVVGVAIGAGVLLVVGPHRWLPGPDPAAGPV